MDVKYISTTSSKLAELPVIDGQLIVLTDINASYYDMNKERRLMSSMRLISTLPAVADAEEGVLYGLVNAAGRIDSYLFSSADNSFHQMSGYVATSSSLGLVKPDGTTITIDSNGVISAQAAVTSLPATAITYDNTESGLESTNSQEAIDEVLALATSAESASVAAATQAAQAVIDASQAASSASSASTEVTAVASRVSTLETTPVSASAMGLAPKVTNVSGFLKGDGTWAVPENTTYEFNSSYDPTTNKAATMSDLTKANVGLGDVDNKSSSTIRSELTSDNITAALEYTPMNAALKGANSGVAELDETGKVPSSQLPSYVDDVLEFSSASEFPEEGESGKIYVDASTNITYRWGGSDYVAIGSDLALGETSSTAYRGDRGKAAYDHSQVITGNPHNVTASDVGLGNVGNFKAVSTVASQSLSDAEKANARGNLALGDASLKAVDTSIGAASSSTNVPTSAAVASFVEGKGYKTTDTDTTYTFGEGSTDGTFTVTPSGGSSITVTVHGVASASALADIIARIEALEAVADIALTT